MFEEVVQDYLERLQDLISCEKIRFDSDLHSALPKDAGVYRIIRANDETRTTLYVGTSKNLQDRLYSNLLMGDVTAHTLRNKLIKSKMCSNEEDIKNYLRNNCLIQFEIIPNKKERHYFEHFAISILKPQFND